MSILEEKQKMGLIPFKLKNIRNTKSKCVPFSEVINGLKQEEKYAVYEDNYYRLQERMSFEREREEKLGMPLERLIAIFEDGFWAVAAEDDSPDVFQICDTRDVDFDFDNKEIIVYFELSETVYKTYKFKDYGKTWALTKEEIKNE